MKINNGNINMFTRSKVNFLHSNQHTHTHFIVYSFPNKNTIYGGERHFVYSFIAEFPFSKLAHFVTTPIHLSIVYFLALHTMGFPSTKSSITFKYKQYWEIGPIFIYFKHIAQAISAIEHTGYYRAECICIIYI